MNIFVNSIEVLNYSQRFANPNVNYYFVKLALIKDSNKKLMLDRFILETLRIQFSDWSKVILIVDSTYPSTPNRDLCELPSKFRMISPTKSCTINGYNFIYAEDLLTIKRRRSKVKNVVFLPENSTKLWLELDVPLYAVIRDVGNWKITNDPTFICTKDDSQTGSSYLALTDSGITSHQY